MAQVGWVWLDNKGGKYRVGIYHGDQSGHVAIHCNLRIVQIDFSVKESRTYSFFIEDELCEIRLEKQKDGRFSYDFQINKTIDTPRNQVRKADERLIKRHTIGFVVGFLALLGLLFVVLKQYGIQQEHKKMAIGAWLNGVDAKNATRLSLEGETTEAQLFLTKDTSGTQAARYRFITKQGATIYGNMPGKTKGPMVLPNGFILKDEDAFQVRYLPDNPYIYRIDFFQPAHATMEEYMASATLTEHQNHPNQTPEQCACLARLVLEEKGWPLLADVLGQQQTPQENPRHNRDTYLRLIRETEFNKALREKCWLIGR